MRNIVIGAVAAGCAASAAFAQAPALAPALAGAGFLLGAWSSGRGEVADTGGTATGSSTITAEAGGAVLLRRDHTDLYDKAGKPAGGFEQIMLIYPEGGTLRGDYSDGSHVIHYVSAVVQPGRSVTFTSAAQPGAPTFKLAYELTAPGVLSVSFMMAPPGGAPFQPIATGVLKKAG